MAFGKPKEPKEEKPKKQKKEKPPKAPKEKKPKKPKKEKPPKAKKGKKGENVPEAVEGQEEQPKKKLPLPLLLIALAVIVAAAVVVFLFVIRPRLNADPDPDASVSVEPEPPVLPTEIPIGDDVSIVGMALEADESGALVEKAKTVTYTYYNLVDAGKAAETYASQLAKESPSFTLVDEEFVRVTETPDYTAAEGMVLLARNVPTPAPESTPEPETASAEPTEEVSSDPEESAEPTPTPEPTPEPEPTPPPITYVHTVRITWSPGICVVTADEQEGQVTSPPPTAAAANHSVTQHGAKQILKEMDPVDLELAGTSMDEYEVMPVDGAEIVDGRPCIRLYVYSDNNQPNTNEIMASYLMSIDGEHLYKVDPITNEIKELDYTP